MNTGEQLLKAICDAPAEDTPRLIYADYLDELAEHSGDFGEQHRARAELIRLQIEVARGPDCVLCGKSGKFIGRHHFWCSVNGIDPDNTDIEPDTLVTRDCTCHYLDKQRRVRWILDTSYPVGPTAPGVPPARVIGKELWRPPVMLTAREVRYQRGFVGIVSATCRTFVSFAEAYVRAAPIEQVALCDRIVPRDRKPYGKVGFLYLKSPDGEGEILDTSDPLFDQPASVLPEKLFDLLCVMRDKDNADDATDCYRWLSWACIWYARNRAKIPDWTPRPEARELFPSLKLGVPGAFFTATGEPREFMSASPDDIVDAIDRRDSEVVDFKEIHRAGSVMI